MAASQHQSSSALVANDVESTLALKPRERRALLRSFKPARGNSSTRLGDLVPAGGEPVRLAAVAEPSDLPAPVRPGPRTLPDEAATVLGFDEPPRPKRRPPPRREIPRRSSLPELSLSDLIVEDQAEVQNALDVADTAPVLLKVDETPPRPKTSVPSNSGHRAYSKPDMTPAAAALYSTSDPHVRMPVRRDPASDPQQPVVQSGQHFGFVSQPVVAAWAFEKTAMEGPGVPKPWPPTVGPQRYVRTQVHQLALGVAGIAEPAAQLGRIAWTLVVVACVMATAALGVALA